MNLDIIERAKEAQKPYNDLKVAAAQKREEAKEYRKEAEAADRQAEDTEKQMAVMERQISIINELVAYIQNDKSNEQSTFRSFASELLNCGTPADIVSAYGERRDIAPAPEELEEAPPNLEMVNSG